MCTQSVIVASDDYPHACTPVPRTLPSSCRARISVSHVSVRSGCLARPWIHLHIHSSFRVGFSSLPLTSGMCFGISLWRRLPSATEAFRCTRATSCKSHFCSHCSIGDDMSNLVGAIFIGNVFQTSALPSSSKSISISGVRFGRVGGSVRKARSISMGRAVWCRGSRQPLSRRQNHDPGRLTRLCQRPAYGEILYDEWSQPGKPMFLLVSSSKSRRPHCSLWEFLIGVLPFVCQII